MHTPLPASGTQSISVISSMATKHLLTDLVHRFSDRTGIAVDVQSVGGVDAAKRVSAGESFDVVMLSRQAIQGLVNEGRLLADSVAHVVDSGVSMVVRQGAKAPVVATSDDVKAAVLQARNLSYSTGPSGVHLAKLFEAWGIAELVATKLVQAPPGVPVGTLVADGRVELGFQQLSELIHLPGVQIIGALPDDIQITTTFSAARTASTQLRAEVTEWLNFLVSPEHDELKVRHGMRAPVRRA